SHARLASPLVLWPAPKVQPDPFMSDPPFNKTYWPCRRDLSTVECPLVWIAGSATVASACPTRHFVDPALLRRGLVAASEPTTRPVSQRAARGPGALRRGRRATTPARTGRRTSRSGPAGPRPTRHPAPARRPRAPP